MFGANRYRAQKATTASPGELLVMLYEGIERFVTQGKTLLDAGDKAAATVALGRALDIIGYLQATLREDAGADLVASLDRLYLAWTAVLGQASVKSDASQLDDVLAQVAQMRQAWETARDEAEAYRVAG